MIKRLFLRPGDVMQLEDCSKDTATRVFKTLRDCLGKKGHQKISIKEYADYHGIDERTVRDALNIP